MTDDKRIAAHQKEVTANREAFASILDDLLSQDLEGQYALMKNKKVEATLKDFNDAVIMGNRVFEGEPFSVEPITREPINLGSYSYMI